MNRPTLAAMLAILVVAVLTFPRANAQPRPVPSNQPEWRTVAALERIARAQSGLCYAALWQAAGTATGGWTERIPTWVSRNEWRCR